jgi:hypothetical protein
MSVRVEPVETHLEHASDAPQIAFDKRRSNGLNNTRMSFLISPQTRRSCQTVFGTLKSWQAMQIPLPRKAVGAPQWRKENVAQPV